ncbi:hypothetical protein H8959_017070 [Pygathrix nigripes]
MSRETDCGIHINAGPEIGVASTKPPQLPPGALAASVLILLGPCPDPALPPCLPASLVLSGAQRFLTSRAFALAVSSAEPSSSCSAYSRQLLISETSAQMSPPETLPGHANRGPNT